MLELIEVMRGFVAAKALHLAAELGVADLIDEGLDCAESIANRAKCNPDATERLLRALCAIGVVTQPAPGRFALTAAGDALRSNAAGSLRDWLRLNGGLMFRAFADAEHSLRTGEPAFAVSHGLPFFEYLERHHETAAVFDGAMRDFARQATEALVDAYDFSNVRTLVDIGGGTGELLVTVLQRHPHVYGVLFERPHVSENANSILAEAGVSDRCRVVTGNFLERVERGGDAYLLSWVLHDWNDADASRILRSVRAAMDPGARLLVFEALLPDGDEGHFARLGDLVMLVALGGRERTRSEYAALLARAGFEVQRVVATASPRSLIEAVAVD